MVEIKFAFRGKFLEFFQCRIKFVMGQFAEYQIALSGDFCREVLKICRYITGKSTFLPSHSTKMA